MRDRTGEKIPASFEFSDEIVKRSFCAKSGLIASSGCATGGTGWYKTDAIPSTCTACSGMAETTQAAADEAPAAAEGE